jgi:hypothetical protein
MAPPKITPAVRYFDPEVTKVYWVPTIATKTSVTRSELNAGTDLSDDVGDQEGWTVTSEEIETPDLGTRFTSKIGGRTSVDDCSLTMYASSDSVDVRVLLPRGTVGYIVWMDGGDVAGNKCDVFPVTVISNSAMRSVGDDAARRQVQFSVRDEPAESVTVPA